MSATTNKVMQTSRTLIVAAAALFAVSTLSGCEALLHQTVPHDHSHDGHDH